MNTVNTTNFSSRIINGVVTVTLGLYAVLFVANGLGGYIAG